MAISAKLNERGHFNISRVNRIFYCSQYVADLVLLRRYATALKVFVVFADCYTVIPDMLPFIMICLSFMWIT